MAQSWYIEAGCIDIKTLMPWYLVLISITIQQLIVFLIWNLWGAEKKSNPIVADDEQDQLIAAENASQSKAKHKKQSKWANIISNTVITWQLSSLICICIFDVIEIMEFVHINDSSWNGFKCLSSILAVSSNTMTLSIIGITWSGNLLHRMNDDTPIMQQLKKQSPLQIVYIIVVFILAECYFFCSTIVFMFVGMIYIWTLVLTSVIYMLPFALFLLMLLVCQRCCAVFCCLDYVRGFFKYLSPDADYAFVRYLGIGFGLWFAVTVPTMVNFYSSWSYWDSIWSVIVERQSNAYFEYEKDNANKFIRAIVWFLS